MSLAGMGANSEWVLNGPYLDKTLIRNKLVYDLARELNGWAPDTRFVELFVDGEYQGVYLAVEPVTNGESRLRLSEFSLLSGETAYIVSRDRSDTESEE
ncbi:MAG: CotH kinase family protein, partial [Blautia sp.]|uniref:CotH kinase family protein n=1 Tax=Blautia sp. TaxID=1955243 RepID=UPI002A80BF7F